MKKHKKLTHKNISNYKSKTSDSTLSTKSDEVGSTKSDAHKDKKVTVLFPKYSYSIFTLVIFISGVYFGKPYWQKEKNNDLDNIGAPARKILPHLNRKIFTQ